MGVPTGSKGGPPDRTTASRNAACVRHWGGELGPDVALVDIDLGGENGFDVARRLSPTPVIMISTHSGEDYEDLIEAGAAIGFLNKVELSGAAERALLGR